MSVPTALTDTFACCGDSFPLILPYRSDNSLIEATVRLAGQLLDFFRETVGGMALGQRGCGNRPMVSRAPARTVADVVDSVKMLLAVKTDVPK